MFGRFQNKIDAALACVRRAQPLTHIEVQACLRDLRAALIAIEVRDSDIDALFDALLGEIADSKMMLASDAGSRVEVMMRRALLAHSQIGAAIKHLGEADVLSPTKPTKASRWDFKELDNHLANKNRPSTAFRFIRTASERRVGKHVDLRHRSPFDGSAALQNDDTHDRNLDRATVDRLLRDLGKGSSDFGPEPPTGGQPARI